jgi:hypothetical protein
VLLIALLAIYWPLAAILLATPDAVFGLLSAFIVVLIFGLIGIVLEVL